MEYPMIVSLVTSGKRAVFPDFPGCLVHYSFKQLTTSLDPSIFETAFIKKVAREYLSTWIKTRLRDGYRVARPHAYGLPGLKAHEEIWTLELWPELDFALEFHWIRLELGWDTEHMARLLDLQTECYENIETARAMPDDRQIAKLAKLQDWINQHELRATASCDGP